MADSSEDRARYFECAFDHDKDHEGNLPPARVVGLTVMRPISTPNGVDIAPETVYVEPVKDTRLFKTDDPVVAEALAQCPDVREIDKPSQKVLKEHRDQTAAYVAAQSPSPEA